METIPQLMVEIRLFALVGVLAGVGLAGVILHLRMRWKRLERMVVRKIRHLERLADDTSNLFAHRWHRAQIEALDEVLVVMGELERGRRVHTYALRMDSKRMRTGEVVRTWRGWRSSWSREIGSRLTS